MVKKYTWEQLDNMSNTKDRTLPNYTIYLQAKLDKFTKANIEEIELLHLKRKNLIKEINILKKSKDGMYKIIESCLKKLKALKNER